MPEHGNAPAPTLRLDVGITAEAVAVLTDLDPFGHGIEETATSWVHIWCRGNYGTESITCPSWPVAMTLSLVINPHAYAHLIMTGNDLSRTPEDIASIIINQRAADLGKGKQRSRLI